MPAVGLLPYMNPIEIWDNDGNGVFDPETDSINFTENCDGECRVAFDAAASAEDDCKLCTADSEDLEQFSGLRIPDLVKRLAQNYYNYYLGQAKRFADEGEPKKAYDYSLKLFGYAEAAGLPAPDPVVAPLLVRAHANAYEHYMELAEEAEDADKMKDHLRNAVGEAAFGEVRFDMERARRIVQGGVKCRMSDEKAQRIMKYLEWAVRDYESFSPDKETRFTLFTPSYMTRIGGGKILHGPSLRFFTIEHLRRDWLYSFVFGRWTALFGGPYDYMDDQLPPGSKTGTTWGRVGFVEFELGRRLYLHRKIPDTKHALFVTAGSSISLQSLGIKKEDGGTDDRDPDEKQFSSGVLTPKIGFRYEFDGDWFWLSYHTRRYERYDRGFALELYGGRDFCFNDEVPDAWVTGVGFLWGPFQL